MWLYRISSHTTGPGSLWSVKLGLNSKAPGSIAKLSTVLTTQLSSCTPPPPSPAQNKASLWGTVVGFVPPFMPSIPQTCPGSPSRHRPLGGAGVSVRPYFPFFFWCYHSFRPNYHDILPHLFSEGFCLFMFYWLVSYFHLFIYLFWLVI